MTKNAAWIVLIVTTLIVNCAAQKVNIGTPETSIAMQYRQPVGTMNHYRMTNNSTNEIEMMGRSTSSSSSQNAAIMHKIGALKEGKIIHELLYTHIEVDTTNVPMMINKASVAKFTNSMINVPLLVETGLKGENPNPQGITDIPAPGSSRDKAHPQFLMGLMGILHEVAPSPVKIGDKWTTVQTITNLIAGKEITSTVTTEYTFAGIEKKVGFDCMKITGEAEVNIDNSVVTNRLNMKIDGEESRKITANFAYREGFFVEVNIEVNSNSTTTIENPNSRSELLKNMITKANTETITRFIFVNSEK